ncbi:hypothetical protein HAX54_051941 [Datura stramonium]|uniref:Uncharacterized protein n=1 Tax=Datura stramonium TaxID=4076 RepID=A0ABS8WQC6_DATST|nr:hypothetical protein [Datura stramonium]
MEVVCFRCLVEKLLMVGSVWLEWGKKEVSPGGGLPALAGARKREEEEGRGGELERVRRWFRDAVAMVTRVSPEISEGFGRLVRMVVLRERRGIQRVLRRCRCLRRRKMEILVVRQCCFAGEGEQTRKRECRLECKSPRKNGERVRAHVVFGVGCVLVVCGGFAELRWRLFGESGGGKRRCAGDRGGGFGWWRRCLVGGRWIGREGCGVSGVVP